MDKKTARQALDRLHEKVDRFFEDARKAQPDAFVCGPGCHECCLVDLSVFEVEADKLAAHFETLPESVRSQAERRARQGEHCAFLDEEGKCVVYRARPLICRSHGLAIQVEDRLDYCPLNFRDEPPDPAWVLDVDRLDIMLVTVNRAFGGTGRRVRLADIALGTWKRS